MFIAVKIGPQNGVFCVKIRAGVSAVGDSKNSKIAESTLVPMGHGTRNRPVAIFGDRYCNLFFSDSASFDVFASKSVRSTWLSSVGRKTSPVNKTRREVAHAWKNP